uniref:Dihydroorotase n=1 Tax=Phenylobacterium glaciei TaxID=2803784 RepID=A0A974P473_9CAUL|nr:dihydroorotase [Phenylobacterium glaciei]
MLTSDIDAAPVEARNAATCLTLRRPDDWHVHLRDGPMLASVVNYTARQFARAIVMPNLSPPITTIAAAKAYRDRILAALEPGRVFQPLMTCYLTDTIEASEVERGFVEGVFTACKLYPAHATTNSDHGVTDVRKIYPVLEVMQNIGMPLLLHGEVTDRHVDIFDREAVFIERILGKLIRDFPGLKVVFEHITTVDAVAFVEAGGPNLAATITPHHLAINRNAMFEGGIRPHFYCLPVAKRETHRLALRRAATSGSAKFFLGTDSAPMRSATRSRRAGARESSTLPSRWKAMRRCSMKRMRSGLSESLRQKMVLASTAWHPMRAWSFWSDLRAWSLDRCSSGHFDRAVRRRRNPSLALCRTSGDLDQPECAAGQAEKVRYLGHRQNCFPPISEIPNVR